MNVCDVRKLRGRLGLNQVEFSQIAGVHPITVSKWERKEAVPTAYQTALFEQFREAARNREVRRTLKHVLVAMGVVLALALLLRHLMKK
jgi:transcriptional regulator with XRE-family HTH domain